MVTQEIPCLEIVSYARQCRETADFLYANIKDVNCVSPLMMIAGFGIELYLKSLNAKLVYHQDELFAALAAYRVTAAPLKKGHPLVALLDALEPEYRDGLTKVYEANPAVSSKPTLRDALTEYNDVFVASRYPFEESSSRSSRSITGLVRLLGCIADHVATLAPVSRL